MLEMLVSGLPQHSQDKCVATFDLVMHTHSKRAAMVQGKSRRNIWGQGSSNTAKHSGVDSYQPAAAGKCGSCSFQMQMNRAL